MTITNQTKEHMAAAIAHLKEELKNIRTGRANPASLDSLVIEAYGTTMHLKDLATVAAPEIRQLLITPFDGSTTASISKSIEKANLGMVPIVDGNVIRLNVPPMDESLRKEMVKLVHKKKEESKVSIRNVRREGNETIRKQKSEGEIAEDMLHRIEKEIQELTDTYCKQADEIAENKEKEVLSI